ncbi:MAG: hypothetical protein KJ558_16260 [Gammaproteobacteria bacterium]|nr:hypothetical protein [Gammaproteobacteria bacterium]MBU1656344.1 hypothetical protein [Gammaproteobacteria bacterium]MBU1959908.1 hypothetical protein [Gammaproteobacteria bacterium]
MSTAQTLWLILAWNLYFIIHSTLASLWFKRLAHRRFPGLTPYHRLIFNTQALLLLAAPLGLTLLWRGEPLWQWQGAALIVANGLALAALALFTWSLNFYDTGEFLGLRQVRENRREVADQERLRISPLHRFVRHPWYGLGLVLIWSRDMDPALLTASLCATAYLMVGSLLEERKLIQYHGDIYREYRKHVPGLIPLPWKWLSRTEARRLAQAQEMRINGTGLSP